VQEINFFRPLRNMYRNNLSPRLWQNYDKYVICVFRS